MWQQTVKTPKCFVLVVVKAWMVARDISSSASCAQSYCLGCRAVTEPWVEPTPPGHPTSLQDHGKDVLLWWRMWQTQDWLHACGTAVEAGSVSTLNGLSCGQVRGKDCWLWKFSPIAVTAKRKVICVCHSCYSATSQGEPLQKAGIAKEFCCAQFWQEIRDKWRMDFFHALKAEPFRVDLSTWEWDGLQELMLRLHLYEVSLN